MSMRNRVEWIPLSTEAHPTYRQVAIYTSAQCVQVRLQSVPQRDVLDAGSNAVTHQFAWDELFNEGRIAAHLREELPAVAERVRGMLANLSNNWADARRTAHALR